MNFASGGWMTWACDGTKPVYDGMMLGYVLMDAEFLGYDESSSLCEHARRHCEECERARRHCERQGEQGRGVVILQV